jgi:hypothetical protein
MVKHTLCEGYKESLPSIPHCYTQGSPRVKQPPGSGWKPSPRWWALVSSHRSLHRVWGHGTAPLPGCSSTLCVSKESQERNLSMGSLVCWTNGDAPGPQVFCPRWAAGVVTWPGEALTEPVFHLCWMRFLSNQILVFTGSRSLQERVSHRLLHIEWCKHTLKSAFKYQLSINSDTFMSQIL